MRFRNREINVFNMSALDLFASALGAFILVSLVLMPYFLRVSHAEVDELRQELTEAQAMSAQAEQRLEETQSTLEECRARDASCQEDLATARQSLGGLQSCQSELAACETDLAEAQSLESEVREQLEQVQGDLEQCLQREASCQERISGNQRDAGELQQCTRDLESCEERLAWTFLAVVIHWDTELHDVDLHIIDAAGEEFSYEARTITGRPGELSVDMLDGPGVEIWELVTEAPAGEYRVLYNLYSKNGSPEPAYVKGGIYYRDGALRFSQRRLTVEQQKVLVAVVTVSNDGRVEVSER